MAEQIQITKHTPGRYTEPIPLSFHGFGLLIFTKGEANILCGQSSVAVKAGESILLRPEPQYFLSCDNGCEYLRIDFSEESFYRACLPVLRGCPLLCGFFIQNSSHLSMSYLHFQKAKEDIIPPVENMLSEYQKQDSFYESLLLCKLMSLLLLLSRSCWVETSMSGAQNDRLLQDMLSYIVNHNQNISLKSMAEVFHFHPNSISTILKKGTGKSFQQLLDQSRMSHVAELLGSVTVQEAAEACGYKNMSNFYTRFQNYYGMTPGEYAQKLHKPREPEQAL